MTPFEEELLLHITFQSDMLLCIASALRDKMPVEERNRSIQAARVLQHIAEELHDGKT